METIKNQRCWQTYAPYWIATGTRTVIIIITCLMIELVENNQELTG